MTSKRSRLTQILQDDAVRILRRSHLTAFHASRDGLLQCLQLVQLGAHRRQVALRQIPRFQAGALLFEQVRALAALVQESRSRRRAAAT
jgi:hypothetical protein